MFHMYCQCRERERKHGSQQQGSMILNIPLGQMEESGTYHLRQEEGENSNMQHAASYIYT